MRTPLELLYNFHWVVPGEAARSAQGFVGFLDRILKRRGIRSLVNLRGHHPERGWWRKEQDYCRRLGIAHFDAMLDSRLLPTRAMLLSLLKAFDEAPKPLLVKCSGGQDRASFAAAIYILHRSGWGALAKASNQFARFPYLHFPKSGQHWLEQFPHYAEMNAHGSPLQAWICEGYDPEAFATWLRENGLGRSFRGIFTSPAEPQHWLRFGRS